MKYLITIPTNKGPLTLDFDNGDDRQEFINICEETYEDFEYKNSYLEDDEKAVTK